MQIAKLITAEFFTNLWHNFTSLSISCCTNHNHNSDIHYTPRQFSINNSFISIKIFHHVHITYGRNVCRLHAKVSVSSRLLSSQSSLSLIPSDSSESMFLYSFSLDVAVLLISVVFRTFTFQSQLHCIESQTPKARSAAPTLLPYFTALNDACKRPSV
jgi:hypothetical protein